MNCILFSLLVFVAQSSVYLCLCLLPFFQIHYIVSFLLRLNVLVSFLRSFFIFLQHMCLQVSNYFDYFMLLWSLAIDPIFSSSFLLGLIPLNIHELLLFNLIFLSLLFLLNKLFRYFHAANQDVSSYEWESVYKLIYKKYTWKQSLSLMGLLGPWLRTGLVWKGFPCDTGSPTVLHSATCTQKWSPPLKAGPRACSLPCSGFRLSSSGSCQRRSVSLYVTQFSWFHQSEMEVWLSLPCENKVQHI